uniref:RRM domain-containing protein n=1 Tax=Arcella intermedia TaxID=1963864 RepID=A0A6B2LHB4_9EUKA
MASCTLIVDRRTNQSKRYGFVYFVKEEDAVKAKDALNQTVLHGNKVRIDFSYTRKPHSPTPGRYMGKYSEPRGGSHRSRYHGYEGSYYPRSPMYDYDYDRRKRDYYDRYDRYDRYDDYYERRRR